MAMFGRAANQFSPLFKKNTACLCRKKMEILYRKQKKLYTDIVLCI